MRIVRVKGTEDEGSEPSVFELTDDLGAAAALVDGHYDESEFEVEMDDQDTAVPSKIAINGSGEGLLFTGGIKTCTGVLIEGDITSAKIGERPRQFQILYHCPAEFLSMECKDMTSEKEVTQFLWKRILTCLPSDKFGDVKLNIANTYIVASSTESTKEEYTAISTAMGYRGIVNNVIIGGGIEDPTLISYATNRRSSNNSIEIYTDVKTQTACVYCRPPENDSLSLLEQVSVGYDSSSELEEQAGSLAGNEEKDESSLSFDPDASQANEEAASFTLQPQQKPLQNPETVVVTKIPQGVLNEKHSEHHELAKKRQPERKPEASPPKEKRFRIDKPTTPQVKAPTKAPSSPAPAAGQPRGEGMAAAPTLQPKTRVNLRKMAVTWKQSGAEQPIQEQQRSGGKEKTGQHEGSETARTAPSVKQQVDEDPPRPH